METLIKTKELTIDEIVTLIKTDTQAATYYFLDNISSEAFDTLISDLKEYSFIPLRLNLELKSTMQPIGYDFKINTTIDYTFSVNVHTTSISSNVRIENSLEDTELIDTDPPIGSDDGDTTFYDKFYKEIKRRYHVMKVSQLQAELEALEV